MICTCVSPSSSFLCRLQRLAINGWGETGRTKEEEEKKKKKKKKKKEEEQE